MAVLLSPVGGVAGQFFDNNGAPLSGGKMYTYVAGTTTPQATYTSAAGSTAHSNPIILDSGGRVPGGEIWLTDGLQYKFVLKTSTDVLIGTYDNIVGINSNFVNFLTETEVQTATASQTVFTLTTMQYQPGTNNLSVFVDGVNQIDGATYSYVETSSTVITFTSGLHVGALVKFTTAQTLSTGVTDASLVTYTPAGTGAVATTVQTKLRESVSVKDFGAVGNGVADDTASIQVAINNGTAFTFTSGTYKITSDLMFPVGRAITFANGAYLLVSAGVTIKFMDNITSQKFQIFSQTGNICVGGDVYPEWWGAKPEIFTKDQCQINTIAFRRATKSYLPEWLAQKTTLRNINVIVSQTRYGLANGFCVPVGVQVIGASESGSFLENYIENNNTEPEVSLLRLGNCFTSEGDLTYTISYPGVDITGPAPTVKNLFFLSSSGTRIVLDCMYSGWRVSDVWFTSVGVAINAGGSDGILNNVIIDQSEVAIQLSGVNIVMANIITYVSNFALKILSNTLDCQINNLHVEFPKIAGIQTESGATNIKNIIITNYQLVMNTQYPSFIAGIFLQSADCEIIVNSFSIRNWANTAVYSIGAGNRLKLSDGVFDTERTNPAYIQSVGGLPFYINGGVVTVDNCDFNNIITGVPIFEVPASLATTINLSTARFTNMSASGTTPIVNNSGANVLNLNVSTTDCGGRYLFVPAFGTLAVTMKGVSNWFKVAEDATYRYYSVPFMVDNNSVKSPPLYNVKLSANTVPAPAYAGYRRLVNDIVGITNYLDVSLKTGISVTNVYKSPTASAPSDLVNGYAFNDPTGTMEIPVTAFGYFCVFYPKSYRLDMVTIDAM